MSSIYADLQDVAAELLTEFGATGTLEKSGVAVVDAAKPWEFTSPASPTTETITGAAVPVTDRSDQAMLDGIDVYSDARWILVSAKGMTNTITPGDHITLVGSKWKIIKATAIQPADLVVMYSCLGTI